MSTRALAQPGESPGVYSTVRRPPAVATVKLGGETRPASTAAWARQRMPLPLISASPPSALCSCMERSQPSRPGPTRMIPSAPMPRRRSASRRTWATENRMASSGSSTTRKSLPAPSCLVACTTPFSQVASLSRARRSACSSSSWASAALVAQVMRGSRRNHEAWRRANWRVRRTASSTQPVQRHAVLQVRQDLAVAQRLARRARQSPGAGRPAPAPRPPGRPRASPPSAPRCAGRSPRAAARARPGGTAAGG